MPEPMTQSQRDDALVAAVNAMETPVAKPPASDCESLWTRLGYPDPESLAAVVGVPASSIRTYAEEGRDGGFVFEPILRRLTRIANERGQ